ncbi:hypothetical protein F5Y16DRAFT_388500 [Xylariaceae sp. FL0255]|nr:hypothetical protein F5Y16DRAFT_388500 [Xylariaceae sp. FL0255]
MEPLSLGLGPPFSEASSLRSAADILLPHAFRCDSGLHHPRRGTREFLDADLKTPKLNKITQYLWLAGLPRPARFLHRQRLLMRNIVLTESPDEHLVWHNTNIWLKPIPEYLLSFEFWKNEICNDTELYKSAYGLLRSYTWLVGYKSDHRIAVETGILPPNIGYAAWTALARDIGVAHQSHILGSVNERYEYGELRLSRLNYAYRMGVAGLSIRNVVCGFISRPSGWTHFFQRNFGWILAVFVYFTVLLSGLQVALATEGISGSVTIQGLSRAFSLLSLLFVGLTVIIILLVWAFVCGFHLLSTIVYIKKTKVLRTGAPEVTSISQKSV